MSKEFYGMNFVPFVGIVKEVDSDNLRARVRVFGIHHMEDITNVSDGDLPWALIQYPVDSTAAHTLRPGTWVGGYFVDGMEAQQPVITGQFGNGQSGPSNGGDIFADRSIGSNGEGNSGGSGGESGDGSTAEPLPTTSATINLPGNSKIEKSYNYIYGKLVENNLSSNPHMHTSAMVGVLMTETYGSTWLGGPANDLYTGGGGGYRGRAWGIAQWLGPRRAKFFSRYGQSTDLSHQLDFMWWELMNDETAARNRWLNANNLEDATAGASSFERNDAWQNGRINRSHEIFVKTYKYAQQIYNTMQPAPLQSSNAGRLNKGME